MKTTITGRVKFYTFLGVFCALSLFYPVTKNTALGGNGECELVRFSFEETVEPGLIRACTRRLSPPDLERAYIVCIPSNLREDPEPRPLLLAFHGGGGTAVNFQSRVAYEVAGENNEFVVAYPNGCGLLGPEILCDCSEELDEETGELTTTCANGTWNDNSGNGVSSICKLDDQRFVAEVVKDINEKYGVVDTGKVYAVGHSKGGNFTYRLGCETESSLGFKLQAIGPVASTLAVQDLENNCSPSGKLSLFHVHNTQDTVIPFDGGGINNDWPPVTPGLQFVAETSGCSVPFLPLDDPSDPHDFADDVCAEAVCADNTMLIELCLLNERGDPTDEVGAHRYDTYDSAFSANNKKNKGIRDAFVERFLE